MRRGLALIALGLGAASWFQAVLAWDGSYQLFTILNAQQLFIPHDRYSVALFQAPVLLATRLTDDLGLLRVVFGLTYSLIPLMVLVACWLVVRRKAPHLMVWPMIGVAMTGLAGQLFLVDEAIIATHVGWLILAIVLVGLPRMEWAVLALLAVFIFFLHPFATPILAAAAVAAFLSGWAKPDRRRLLIVTGAAFMGAALIRTALIQGYESTFFSAPTLASLARDALPGPVLIGLAMAWLSGALLLVDGSFSVPRRLLDVGVVGAPLIALVALITWAARPSDWVQALDYRIFVIFAAAPLYLFMITDALLSRWVPPRVVHNATNHRSVAVELAALVFFAVLTVQAASWSVLQDRLSKSLTDAAAVCVAPTDIASSGTALVHWATPSLAILVQGRSPKHLILSPHDCKLYAFNGRLRVADGYPTISAQDGWFEFPKLRQ